MANSPTLRFRQGNANVLNLSVAQAGQPLSPSASIAMTADLRQVEYGGLVARVPLSAVPSDAALSSGPLPNLQPGLYLLNLRVQRAAEPPFSVAVCRIEILPVGTLAAVSDQSGLNIQITETKQLINAQLDATPSAAICAYYAGLARQVGDDTETARADAEAQAGIATAQAGIATTAAAQAQSLVGNVLALVGQDAQTVTLAVGGSITYTDHPEAAYPYLSLTLL